MGREPEAMRDNIELIRSVYPNKLLLRFGEVVKVTGLGKTTVRKYFKFMPNGYISVADLARQMSCYK